MRYYFPVRYLLAALLGLLSSPVLAQRPHPASVAEILNPDGSIRPGTPGSFDARGYHLSYGPTGEPRLRATAAGDEHWRDGFTIGGTDGSVWAVAVAPNGDVYVAGRFDKTTTTPASSIARWDGARWWPLGAGITGGPRWIFALAFLGNDLYVGGSYSSVDNDTTMRGLARWDGTAWHSVPGYYGGRVQALRVANNRLYVGGRIQLGSSPPVTGVASWDGSRWQTLGGALGGTIYALAVAGSHVYVGGILSSADGVPVRNVAHWDGTHWQGLGAGVDSTVRALAVLGNDVFAGGRFTHAGNLPATGLARWDGAAWSAMGGGHVWVNALLVVGSELYTASTIGTSVADWRHQISRWDGATWHRVGDEAVQSWTIALATAGTHLLAGGQQGCAGSIIRWDATAWAPLGEGLTDAVYAVARLGNDIYVGGAFYQAGGASAHYLARWDGSQWHALPASPNAWVDALAVRGTDLYVGGNFTQVGSLPANHIARWDGTQWHALAGGTDGPVYALAGTSAGVFAGGHFTQAGNVATSHIARWDGSSWQALGRGVRANTADALSGVWALAATDSALYVGGVFDSVGTIAGAALARWDGNQWTRIGNMLNGSSFNGYYVTAIAVVDSGLYVGGSFLTTTSQPMALGFWKHTAWSGHFAAPALPQGLFTISAIVAVPNQLYVGGTFQMVGGVLTNNIARWDGTVWHSLGSGLNANVAALAVVDSTIYAGGNFTALGDNARTSRYFAIYDPTYAYVNGLSTEATSPTRLRLYPNPTPATRIHLTGSRATTATILDAAGRAVRQAAIGFDGTLDLRGLAPGLYLLRAGNVTARLVVE